MKSEPGAPTLLRIARFRPEDGATTTSVRVVALCLGIAGVVFALLGIPDATAQWYNFEPWWLALAITAFLVAPTALGVVALAAGPRVIRAFAATGAIIMLATLILFRAAFVPPHLEVGDAPWILTLTAFGPTMAALAWSAPLTFAYLLVMPVFVAYDRVVSVQGGDLLVGVQDAVFGLMFSAVFASLILAVKRASGGLDQSIARARDEVALAATERAKAEERDRVHSLIHDRVFGTLLLAARADDAASNSLAATQALLALEELRKLRADQSLPAPDLSPRDLAWKLQALTTELVPEAMFTYEVGDEPPCIPATVVQAVTAAAGEALRNTANHADRPGDPANRNVHVVAGKGGVEITIIDDGVGFEPSLVPTARMGIQASIRERMGRLPGGSAVVVSRPGHGTRVVIRWSAP